MAEQLITYRTLAWEQRELIEDCIRNARNKIYPYWDRGVALITLERLKVPNEYTSVYLIDVPRLCLARWSFKEGYAVMNVKRYGALLGMSIESDSYDPCSKVGMHRVLLPDVPGLTADHIDRNKLHNLPHNLRYATPTEQIQNRKVGCGYVGVYRDMSRVLTKPFNSICRGRRLGYFATTEEAARAYDLHLRTFHPSPFNLYNFVLGVNGD